MGSTRLMSAAGDVTIAWDDDSEELITGLIRKKMAEGMAFFVVSPRLGGLLPPRRKKLGKSADLSKLDAVVVSDADFAELLKSGAATMTAATGKVETVKRAKTPEEAAKADTVAVKPMKGG